ncbi:MAG: Mrp/NBP35 family ATP-binding protein [Anaerolineaceae bacterium]|nr:Mrp/NBP35 family ATP-binding protein [Anaerolineaceae bacterium]
METQQILDLLKQVNDPELKESIVELGMVRDVAFADGKVTFTLALTIPGCPMKERMAADARAVLLAQDTINEVEIIYGAMSKDEVSALFNKVKKDSKPSFLAQMNRVDKIIAVMSGKGGVGKSSITGMLASSAARMGKKVGILDADITGPSIPKLFGLPPGGLRGGDAGMMPALTRGRIKVVSTNLLLKEEDTPTVWRGPLIAATIRQFWEKTLWGKLDFLFVDLPPGTSDAAITVLRNLPLSGVIMVTTPQDLSALVVKKAIHMVQQMNYPILGIVENMSYYPCPDTGNLHEIFGPSHVDQIAEMANVALSARLPITPEITAHCDAGTLESLQLDAIDQIVKQLIQ